MTHAQNTYVSLVGRVPRHDARRRRAGSSVARANGCPRSCLSRPISEIAAGAAAGIASGIAAGIVLGILTLVPILNLIILLVINGRATNLLRKHGIKVGLMGAKASQIPAPGQMPIR